MMKPWGKLCAVLLVAGLWGCAVSAQAPTPDAARASSATATYIVTLKPEHTDVAAQARRLVAAAAGAQLGHIYQSALRGFSVQMSAQAAERMRQDAAVLSIEADAPVRIQPVPR
jgi:hypothetical protein